MNLEKENSEFEKRSDSLLLARNSLQVEILKRHCEDCSDSDKVDLVLKTISPGVAKILEAEPELIDQFEDDREKVIGYVENKLFSDDLEKAA